MKIVNRRATYDYTILETLEAGILLLGSEVKMVKSGRMNLEGAFVRLLGNETYLVNADIPLYEFSRSENYDSRRTRKLLLHKAEITRLQTKMAQSNLTLVPLSCYNKGRFIKLEVGIGRGKKMYEKREKIKTKDIERETQRILRGKLN